MANGTEPGRGNGDDPDFSSNVGGAGPLRRPSIRIAIAAAVLALIGGGIYLGVSSSSGGAPATLPTSTPTSASPMPAVNPLTGVGPDGRVLAVKIDNVGAAQFQQAGLNSADVVYAIQVEGGLSRYLAVFDSVNAPARVGPVRSARQTDIPLLAAYGRVGLAYSGAISGLLPDLAAANLQNITPANASAQFSNGGSSPTYITPAKIFAAYPNLAAAQNIGFQFGAAPADGQPATSVTASMPSASFTFTAAGNKWLVSVDGRPATTTDQGRAAADNVIVQHAQVVPGKYTDHNAGHPDNEVFSETTGQGAAEFYRDGEVWHGQWSKSADTAPTDYTVNGAAMQLATGRTWIVLVADS
jgi:hypothetical protein